MFKIISSACAALMVLTVPFAAPAIATPMPTPSPEWQAQDVIPVQRSGRWQGDDIYWMRGRPHYRGHPGSMHYRQGWRQHGGNWFTPAAFIAGAIIGGAIANQQPAPRYRSHRNVQAAHVDWCYARYRSYREWDNTFQPYHGPRRQCISPYG